MTAQSPTNSVSDAPADAEYQGEMNNHNALKEIREARGLTQKQVAEALNTTEQSVSRMERGTQPISLGKARQVCQVLGCSIAQLAGEVSFDGGAAAGGTEIPAGVSLDLVRQMLVSLERFLESEGKDMAPDEKASLLVVLLQWALDERAMFGMKADIDLQRVRVFIRALQQLR